MGFSFWPISVSDENIENLKANYCLFSGNFNMLLNFYSHNSNFVNLSHPASKCSCPPQPVYNSSINANRSLSLNRHLLEMIGG